MATSMTKPWQPLDHENVARLSGQLGVYEIANSAGETLRIGFAGGRSLFGLRGELERELASRGPGFRFRIEVNMQYTTRYRELLMAYAARHHALPAENAHEPIRLGRLSPG